MIIRSERMMIRPVSERDAELLLAVFRDPAVRRYLLDDAVVSLEWVQNEIVSSDERFASSGAGLFTIRLIGTTDVIGFVGFRDFFGPPRLQLLYGLLPEYWGRGLATEAAKQVCDYAFGELNFARIEAAMDVPNERSIAVAERLGMSRLDGLVQRPEGTVFYGIERDRWNRSVATALSDTGMQTTPQNGAAENGS